LIALAFISIMHGDRNSHRVRALLTAAESFFENYGHPDADYSILVLLRVDGGDLHDRRARLLAGR